MDRTLRYFKFLAWSPQRILKRTTPIGYNFANFFRGSTTIRTWLVLKTTSFFKLQQFCNRVMCKWSSSVMIVVKFISNLSLCPAMKSETEESQHVLIIRKTLLSLRVLCEIVLWKIVDRRKFFWHLKSDNLIAGPANIDGNLIGQKITVFMKDCYWTLFLTGLLHSPSHLKLTPKRSILTLHLLQSGTKN
jgi:hypothetical protein